MKLAGTPPFQLKLGEDDAEALSFEELRVKVLDLAKRGVQLQRFKGLGEMNADQLRETTMDPATRTLQQVTIDDASAADQLFSMLMGDQVEPRRAFIEKHARDVQFLDVMRRVLRWRNSKPRQATSSPAASARRCARRTWSTR